MTHQSKKFIRDNHKGLTPLKMAETAGVKLYSIYSYLRKNRLYIHKEKKEGVGYLKEPV